MQHSVPLEDEGSDFYDQIKAAGHLLKATCSRNARVECSNRWPNNDVYLYGFSYAELSATPYYKIQPGCVYMSFVRKQSERHFPVATARRNRGSTPAFFYAVVEK